MIASATDRLDGQIARSRNLVTDFGKIADPIADKALMGTALVILSWQGHLPWWATILVLVRELGITLLRFWVIRYGVMAASRGGKLKTLLQGFAILFYVLPISAGWWSYVRDWTMAAAVVVTVVTGADYVVRAMRLRRQPTAPAVPQSAVGSASDVGQLEHPGHPGYPEAPDRPEQPKRIAESA